MGLEEWVASVTGGRVVSLTRKTGGSSRSTNMVDVDVNGTTEHYVLRIDTGTGPFSGTDYTLAREAAVYRALQHTDVPVPELVAVNDEGTAFLMRRVDGYDSDKIPDADERAAVADSYIKAIAALHDLDVDALDLPGFHRPVTPADRFLLDLDSWEQIFRDKVTRPEPILAFAFDWLRRHVPTTEDRTVLCWGDVGPGNFMYKDGEVAALLDWELAHLGDPMDDLAFHSLRTYLLFDGSFCDLHWSLERYEHYTGRKVDPERLEYLRIQCLVRWMLSSLAALEFPSGPDMAGSTFLFLTTTVRKWLASLLATAVGVDDIATVLPQPGPRSMRADIIDILTSDLNTVLAPKLADDPVLIPRIMGMNMLLSHLAAADGLAPGIERDERADLARLLGAEPDTVIDGWAALQAGIEAGDISGDQELAAFFVRSADRAGAQWPFIASFLAKRIEPIAP